MELGKIQKLRLKRETKNGVYLEDLNGGTLEEVLLPNKYVTTDMDMGDIIDVFLYKDSEDRLTATTIKPKLTLGKIKMLKAIDITEVGAFLDWGLEKDLFLPFQEQVGMVQKDQNCLVTLYIDKSDRLCATMKIGNRLLDQSPYKLDDKVNATIYGINDEMGIFVAVEDKYNGMIPKNEIYKDYKCGEQVVVRVKSVRDDGKLELSLRERLFKQMDYDSKVIMDALEKNEGELLLNDHSEAEDIKEILGMSKRAFKRAIGRLLKEGHINFTEKGIAQTKDATLEE